MRTSASAKGGTRRLARMLLLAAILAIGAAVTPVAADALDGLERQVVVTIGNPPQLDLRRAGSTLRGYLSSAGGYRANAAARLIEKQLAHDYRLKLRDSWAIAALQVHCVVYEIPDELSRATILEQLRRDARVESAQAMQGFRVLTAGHDPPYNDPYWQLQHNIASLDVAGAHRWARGRGVRIGIIDTGVDVRHPELAGKVVATADFAELNRHRFVTDPHGTAVAGIIAAAINNGLGIVGVAPEATLLVAKACWYEPGSGRQSAAVCSSFTLARALAYALDEGVDVLNLSLTGPRDALLERLVAAAIARDVVVVAAHAEGARAAAFPAGAQGVIAVRAAELLERAFPEPDSIYAPGAEILTLTPEDHYDYFSGSSIAAAHVAGIAALLRQVSPGIPGGAVREVLLRTAGAIRVDAGQTPPLVNACAALAEVMGGRDCPRNGARLVHTARPE